MPYNTLGEADIYFTSRYGYGEWAVLTDDVKNSALLSASEILDLLCTWNGVKTDPEQTAEFPRDGESEVPQAVKTSELEITYAIVTTGSTSTKGDDSLTRLKAGPVEMEFKASMNSGNPLINGTVRTLLSPLGECSFNMGGGSSRSIPVYR